VSSTNAHLYRFDTFEVDPANRLLTRDGHDVHVTGRVFDILLIFVENPGRLLEKSELMEKVWHGDFVEEGNLTRNISTLRKALGDTARQHKFITTVQGHGYRFVANVTEAIHPEDPPAIRERSSANSSDFVHLESKWLWVVLAAALLIVALWEVER
jgi:DNA-binding winged helix-turn-helix (wHTH) protein